MPISTNSRLFTPNDLSFSLKSDTNESDFNAISGVSNGITLSRISYIQIKIPTFDLFLPPNSYLLIHFPDTVIWASDFPYSPSGSCHRTTDTREWRCSYPLSPKDLAVYGRIRTAAQINGSRVELRLSSEANGLISEAGMDILPSPAPTDFTAPEELYLPSQQLAEERMVLQGEVGQFGFQFRPVSTLVQGLGRVVWTTEPAGLFTCVGKLVCKWIDLKNDNREYRAGNCERSDSGVLTIAAPFLKDIDTDSDWKVSRLHSK